MKSSSSLDPDQPQVKIVDDDKMFAKKVKFSTDIKDADGGSNTGIITDTLSTILNDDDKYLAKLGYSSELHRGFNAFMAFTFCFTSVGVICSNALVFEYGLNTGGPVMLTFGWIVGSFFTLLIALSLAEITSTYPVSGSVYHWAGILADKKYAAISSYLCGW